MSISPAGSNIHSSLTTAPITAEPDAVDVSVLQSLIGNDEVLINEFLHDFRVSVIEIGWAVCAAGEYGSAKEISVLAHKLKSASRTVGAMGLGFICEALEHAGKADEADELSILLPIFTVEVARVEAFLLRYQMMS